MILLLERLIVESNLLGDELTFGLASFAISFFVCLLKMAYSWKMDR